jgi:hypothetical protein
VEKFVRHEKRAALVQSRRQNQELSTEHPINQNDEPNKPKMLVQQSSTQLNAETTSEWMQLAQNCTHKTRSYPKLPKTIKNHATKLHKLQKWPKERAFRMFTGGNKERMPKMSVKIQ